MCPLGTNVRTCYKEARMEAYGRLKRNLLVACAAIGVGLAVAGTVSQRVGGAILLVSAGAAILAVHRLGRTGPDLHR